VLQSVSMAANKSVPDPGAARMRARRLDLTNRVVELLLAKGVAQLPLRDLAAQLDTSDRMLLYYFDDKEDLVGAALAEISSRLAMMLAASVSHSPYRPSELLRLTAQLLASPAYAPFMNVWADVSARGGRGEEPFRHVARRSVEGWLQWCESRLAVKNPVQRREVAGAILTAVEGVRMLEAAAPQSTRGALALLAKSLDDVGR
jgi:AcrR family transcriptional regulator